MKQTVTLIPIGDAGTQVNVKLNIQEIDDNLQRDDKTLHQQYGFKTCREKKVQRGEDVRPLSTQ